VKIKKINEEIKPEKKQNKTKKIDGSSRVDFFVSISEEISDLVRSWAAKESLTLSKATELIFSEKLKKNG
jgi:phosphopantetheinyl transferase (holo-ACP synthase)